MKRCPFCGGQLAIGWPTDPDRWRGAGFTVARCWTAYVRLGGKARGFCYPLAAG